MNRPAPSHSLVSPAPTGLAQAALARVNHAPNTTIWSGDSIDPRRVATSTGDVIVVSCASPQRAGNQDAALVVARADATLIAVADGMGGLENGAEASRVTLECVARSFEGAEPTRRALIESVVAGLEAANESILDLRLGGGTTFAGVVVESDRATMLHVGDSEAFHLDADGAVRGHTIPHSPVGRELAAGRIAEEAAMVHAERHLLSQHIGMERICVEEGPARERAPDDRFLVASDGLLDNLLSEEIAALASRIDANDAVRLLLDGARGRMGSSRGEVGKPDDLTFVLHVPHGH